MAKKCSSEIANFVCLATVCLATSSFCSPATYTVTTRSAFNYLRQLSPSIPPEIFEISQAPGCAPPGRALDAANQLRNNNMLVNMSKETTSDV
jgi:hypothetical protein